MFLRLTNADGEIYEDLVLEDARPDKPIRLAIGEPGRRSAIWRVWANRARADVYITARMFGGLQKFSLHASGDWRQQWEPTPRALALAGENGRIIDRWNRPSDPEHGHTTGLSIWVPHGHLDDLPDDTADLENDVHFLPDAPEGHFAGIHITVSAPERPRIQLRGFAPITGFVLAPNPRHPTTPGIVEAVLAIYSQRECTEADEQQIHEALADADGQMRALGGSLEALAKEDEPVRALLHSRNDDGVRSVYELSVRKAVV